MARFRLVAAHHFQGKSYKAGTVVCDGTSCSGGDVIWAGLNSALVSDAMVALDAGATTMKNASRFANVTRAFADGCNSIDP